MTVCYCKNLKQGKESHPDSLAALRMTVHGDIVSHFSTRKNLARWGPALHVLCLSRVGAGHSYLGGTI